MTGFCRLKTLHHMSPSMHQKNYRRAGDSDYSGACPELAIITHPFLWKENRIPP